MMNPIPEVIGSDPNTGKYSLDLKSRKRKVMTVAPSSRLDWAAQRPPDIAVSLDICLLTSALMRQN
jgi:hypothetical protein